MAKHVFKVLIGNSRKAPHGVGRWPDVGIWTRKEEFPRICNSGWHVFEKPQHIPSLYGMKYFDKTYGRDYILWIAEVKGKAHKGRNKAAYQQAKLIKKFSGIIKYRRLLHVFVEGKRVVCLANKIV